MPINWAFLRSSVNGMAGGKAFSQMSDQFCRRATYWKQHDMSVTLICRILIDPQNFWGGLFWSRITNPDSSKLPRSPTFFDVQCTGAVYMIHVLLNFDPVSYHGIGSLRFLIFWQETNLTASASSRRGFGKQENVGFVFFRMRHEINSTSVFCFVRGIHTRFEIV